MDNCCTTTTTAPCPKCSQNAHKVGKQTLYFLLTHPFNKHLIGEQYYFCSNPDCEVVYFCPEGSSYTQAQVRIKVGQKSKAPDRTICYCYDLNAEQFQHELNELGDSPSKNFIVECTRDKQCQCESHNPSGKCCLKDLNALASSSHNKRK